MSSWWDAAWKAAVGVAAAPFAAKKTSSSSGAYDKWVQASKSPSRPQSVVIGPSGGGGGGGNTGATLQSWSGGGDDGYDGGGWSGGGGGGGGISAAQAAANAAAKAQSRKENEATAELARAKHALLGGYWRQRDGKLANIDRSYKASEKALLSNYRTSADGLLKTQADNEKAQGDSTFANVLNAAREQSEISQEVASQGGGETDILRAQLSALRNYDANQRDINRSYFDTARSNTRALDNLNSETYTGRKTLFDRAEDDRDSAWTQYYNQSADTWNEIYNIENANKNIASDTSEAYTRLYANAAKTAAEVVGKTYTKKQAGEGLKNWDGKAQGKINEVTSNKAQMVTIGSGKRAEGASLRKW